MTERPTLAKLQRDIDRVEGKQNGHEELCAERYKNIHDAIGELKIGMKWNIGSLATVAGSLILALLKTAGFIG